VTRVLDWAARFRGDPQALRTDQGPEFTSRALEQWASANGIALKLMQAGKPTQNAYIESFNGRYRNEWLNGTGLRVLPTRAPWSPPGGGTITSRDRITH
jgi:putative transposase